MCIFSEEAARATGAPPALHCVWLRFVCMPIMPARATIRPGLGRRGRGRGIRRLCGGVRLQSLPGRANTFTGPRLRNASTGKGHPIRHYLALTPPMHGWHLFVQLIVSVRMCVPFPRRRRCRLSVLHLWLPQMPFLAKFDYQVRSVTCLSQDTWTSTQHRHVMPWRACCCLWWLSWLIPWRART